MKLNYRAWQIDFDDFAKQIGEYAQLRFLINFAILAPSSHNSQPWKFQIVNNKIHLLPDFSRALLQSDQNHRQLFISIGDALENLLVAADYYGFETAWVYEEISHTVEVSLNKVREHAGNETHLVFAIPRRCTNRNKYLDELPNEDLLKKLKNYSTQNTQLHFIKGKETISKVAEIVSKALIVAMDDKLFRKELSQYVKPNITESPLGMPASGFGIPTPISFIAPTLLRHLNMSKLTKKQDLSLLKDHTPVFGVITTTEDNPISWIEAGLLYERIALEAEKDNLNTAPLAAAIQIGDFYKQLQNILETDQRPQVFFRLGTSAKQQIPHSPRLITEEVTK